MKLTAKSPAIPLVLCICLLPAELAYSSEMEIDHCFRPAQDRVGETAENPIVLSVFPIIESGNTANWFHDYDEACPISGGTAPDVVYEFFNDRYRVVNISLQDSKFDTKVYVYDNYVSPGTALACSDDGFSGPYVEDAVSFVKHLVLKESHTYYFVIDGFGEQCGEYEFTVQEIPPCKLKRPENAIDEGETKCHKNYVDNVNIGCNQRGDVFTFLAPSANTIQVWGTSGTYLSGHQHVGDTDTYELILADERDLTYQLEAEFPASLSLIDAFGGCESARQIDRFDTDVCTQVSDTYHLPAGIYWLKVRPLHDHGVPSGANYILTLEGHNTNQDTFTTRLLRQD
jgi:hypothetical protein